MSHCLLLPCILWDCCVKRRVKKYTVDLKILGGKRKSLNETSKVS